MNWIEKKEEIQEFLQEDYLRGFLVEGALL